MTRLSVVIPAYNRAHVVGRAIGSALAQTRAPDEVIVVDDCSRDATRACLASWQSRDLRVRPVFLTTNRGVSGARNAGIEAARGDLIAFLDSDDAWLPDHLAECAGLLEARPELDLAFSDLRRIRTCGEVIQGSYLTGSKGLTRHLAPCPDRPKCYVFRVPEVEILFQNYVVPVQTSVIRAGVAKAFPFDAALRASEDHQLMLRLARAGRRFGYVDRVLCECFIHDSNLMANGASELRQYGEEIKFWTGILSDPSSSRRDRGHCHRHLARLWTDTAYSLHKGGNPWASLWAYLRSFWHRPSSQAARGLVKAAFLSRGRAGEKEVIR